MAIRSNRSSKKRSRIIAPGVETYELTKIDVAEAHIRTAVRLFFEEGHPVPIYHLASSAREILTTIGEKVKVETILHSVANQTGIPFKALIAVFHNYARFFKHANSDPTDKITFRESDVDPVLYVACHDFGRVTGGMPVEAQVFQAWSFSLGFQRITDAPLRLQPLLKRSIKQFPGLRAADRKTQKQIGLEALKRAESDPSLQMEFEREVKLVSEP